MSDEKIRHTPGPWEVELDVVDDGDINIFTQMRSGFDPLGSPIALIDVKDHPNDDDSPPRELALGNAALCALAPTAPHRCDVPGCPGNENRRKLEEWAAHCAFVASVGQREYALGAEEAWNRIEAYPALVAENERLKADVARLREQNHEAASRFQKQISELEARLLPDSLDMQERERVRAFLNLHPNERYGDVEKLKAQGLTGYSRNDGTAVLMAFRMHDEQKATNAALVEALKVAIEVMLDLHACANPDCHEEWCAHGIVKAREALAKARPEEA